MTRGLRIQLLAVLLLAVLAAIIVAPIPNKPSLLAGFRINPGIDLAGGAELRYRVLLDPGFKGDREAETRQVADVVRRRVDSGQLQEPKINSSGEDLIVIQLAGIDADALGEYKKRFGTMGNLQLFATAPQDLQERHDREGVVPIGCRVVRDRNGQPLLIEDRPVIEGRHLVSAEPRPEAGPGGLGWVTSFELNAEGSKLFDEAAEKLYHRRPRGRIVVLLDGEVRSAPVVESPAFHGRGQISGRKE